MIEKIRECLGTLIVLVICLILVGGFFYWAKEDLWSPTEKGSLVIFAWSILYIAFAVFGMWLGFVKQDEHFMVCAALGLAGPATVPLYLFYHWVTGDPVFGSRTIRRIPTPTPLSPPKEDGKKKKKRQKGQPPETDHMDDALRQVLAGPKTTEPLGGKANLR